MLPLLHATSACRTRRGRGERGREAVTRLLCRIFGHAWCWVEHDAAEAYPTYCNPDLPDYCERCGEIQRSWNEKP